MLNKVIRVFLTDDHVVLRSGLRLLINSQSDMNVVGEAGEGQEAVRRVKELSPDVTVMDLGLPKMRGLQATELILLDNPAAVVIALTMHEDESYARSFLAAGGRGYVLKQAVDSELMGAIRYVARGRIFVDPHLGGAIISQLLTRNGSKKLQPVLSHRESEVLRMLAFGHTNHEAAICIGISIKTVETYRARLAEKLGLKSRPEIVRYALEHSVLRSESDAV